MLELQPIDWDEAREFVSRHHRHHKPPPGWKFGIAVNDGEKNCWRHRCRSPCCSSPGQRTSARGYSLLHGWEQKCLLYALFSSVASC